METLEHEDLLIRLRAKLNEEKIKLWETPYISENSDVSESLKGLSAKYASALNLHENLVLQGLHELQLHSIERSKANEEFKETGCATLRVRATVTGEKPKVLKVVKPLKISGEDLVTSISELLSASSNIVKLIYNGKIIDRNKTLEEQGVKNGVQIMALVMAVSPELVKKEDNMYMEMKSTINDTTLLTDHVDDLGDDEYIRLEDQSGQAVELPSTERKALMVGLALHERGRAASINRDYALALVLLLEADRQLSECRSSILSSVDNCAILQLDIAWCYLCLQNLSSANDASSRLARAERAFVASYGEDHQRLIALKGSNANERVLFMRLYLLQGIVAYHQNKRAEARALLERAETELNYLRVDEHSVSTLMELGWSAGQARTGLRAVQGSCDAAHHLLEERRRQRDDARTNRRAERMVSSVRARLLRRLGVPRAAARRALRRAGDDLAAALRLARGALDALDALDAPASELKEGSDDDMDTSSSDDSSVEPDNRLVAELETMGYPTEQARNALRLSQNDLNIAVELLMAGCTEPCDTSNPSTSAAESSRKKQRKENKELREKKRKDREMALRRLQQTIGSDEDDYLSASLAEEEQFLAQYKSLL